MKEETKIAEIWKDVVGFCGLYRVSNLGNVSTASGRILKPSTNPKGYAALSLYKEKKAYSFRVHRLVAIAFIPNPNNYDQVNHKDAKKLNNRVDNLEWCNNLQNIRHAHMMGLMAAPNGERNGHSSISDKTAQAILDSEGPHYLIAKRFNTTSAVVKMIRNRVNWKHLTPSKDRVVNPQRKLTAEQVAEIRTKWNSYSKMAAHYNVSKATVAEIVQGRTWKDI